MPVVRNGDDTTSNTKSETQEPPPKSSCELPPGNSREVSTEVKLADLNVPISSIKPSPAVPPLTLQESEDGE